ncbi:MAG: patatin-like phospholipase family protein [Clostridia bacterium]|nr:patatin-like phospholipase family protein [Clostridia bacterium]
MRIHDKRRKWRRVDKYSLQGEIVRGLVLQGGGAKGAFQAGAIKALLERGYTFDGVVGTSIGALNATLMAQGEFDILYTVWETMGIDKVLDVDAEKWSKIKSKDFSKTTISYIKDFVVNFFRKGGLETTKAKALISQYTNEEKLRKSKIDFGLVTVMRKGEFSFEAKTLFKDDIPEGMIADYVMASANFPLFTKHTIGENRYYDGGLYDNLPINMLLDKGYDDIVAIRLGDSLAPVKKPYISEAKIMYIDPSDKIGSVLDFDSANIQKAIKTGYYDAIRAIDKLDGRKYCIEPLDANAFDALMLNLPDSFYDYCVKVFETDFSGVRLDKYIFVSKKLQEMLKLKSERKVVWMTLIEIFAEYAGVDRYKVYSFDELLEKLRYEYYRGFRFAADIKKKLQKSNTREAKGMQIIKALLKLLGEAKGDSIIELSDGQE